MKLLFQLIVLFFVQIFSLQQVDAKVCENRGHKIEAKICSKFYGVQDSSKEFLIKDLERLSQLQGEETSQLHRQIFGFDIDGQKYVDWIVNRIDLIVDGSNHPTFAQDQRFALAAWYQASWKKTKKNILYYNSRYERDPHFLSRISLLIHEARHLQPEVFSHVDCEFPDIGPYDTMTLITPFSNQSFDQKNACDQSAIGSYGIEVVFAKNIIDHCHNCDEQMKNYAKEFVNNRTKRIIPRIERMKLVRDLFRPTAGEALRYAINRNDFESIKTIVFQDFQNGVERDILNSILPDDLQIYYFLKEHGAYFEESFFFINLVSSLGHNCEQELIDKVLQVKPRKVDLKDFELQKINEVSQECPLLGRSARARYRL